MANFFTGLGQGLQQGAPALSQAAQSFAQGNMTDDALNLMQQYQQTQDPALYAQAMTKDPRTAQDFITAIGVNDQNKAKELTGFVMGMKPLLQNGISDELIGHIENRVNTIEARGGDASQARSMLRYAQAGDSDRLNQQYNSIISAQYGSGLIPQEMFSYLQPTQQAPKVGRYKIQPTSTGYHVIDTGQGGAIIREFEDASKASEAAAKLEKIQADIDAGKAEIEMQQAEQEQVEAGKKLQVEKDLLKNQQDFDQKRQQFESLISGDLEGLNAYFNPISIAGRGAKEVFGEVNSFTDGLVPGSAAFDFGTKLDTFREALTLGVLEGKPMQGPLTDKDIQVIKQAASSLNPNMSREALVAEIDRINQLIQQGYENKQAELMRQSEPSKDNDTGFDMTQTYGYEVGAVIEDESGNRYTLTAEGWK